MNEIDWLSWKKMSFVHWGPHYRNTYYMSWLCNSMITSGSGFHNQCKQYSEATISSCVCKKNKQKLSILCQWIQILYRHYHREKKCQFMYVNCVENTSSQWQDYLITWTTMLPTLTSVLSVAKFTILCTF